ncbi:MAG: hypothetical protein M3Q44_00375 [bacterium]|nr:hypothetical protein [bacterium]
MKKTLSVLLGVAFTLATVSTVFAAPNNAHKAENNPNVVAYYPLGLHAIPTSPVTYFTGTNLVTKRGNSGQIQAWYTGTDNHGYHSVWNLAKKGTCPSDWNLIASAYPSWGDYLVPGADYCVKVNAF